MFGFLKRAREAREMRDEREAFLKRSLDHMLSDPEYLKNLGSYLATNPFDHQASVISSKPSFIGGHR